MYQIARMTDLAAISEDMTFADMQDLVSVARKYHPKGVFGLNCFTKWLIDELRDTDTFAGGSFIAQFLYTYIEGVKLFDRCEAELTEGYTKDDRREYFRQLIIFALSSAALFATQNCQHTAAFGMGFPSKPYVDPRD